MSRRLNSAISILSFTLLIVIFSSNSRAQLTQNITLGNAKALGLAHAVTADPPGIDSIHFNPAGLAKVKGRRTNINILGAHMLIEGYVGENETPDDVKAAYCSFSRGINAGCDTDSGFAGISYNEPESNWTIATSVYSPMAIGYQRDSSTYAEDENGNGYRVGGDPAELAGEQVSMTRITYFAPSFGLQISDELSVGMSVGFSWHGFGIVTDLRAPLISTAFLNGLQDKLGENNIDLLHVISPYDYLGELTMEMEDALSISFNVGALWEPTEWLSFGIVYQAEAKADMEGDFQMVNTDQLLATTASLTDQAVTALLSLNGDTGFNSQRIEKGKVKSSQVVPAHAAIGTSVKVFPDLKVNLDVKWTEYSSWTDLVFEYDNSMDFLTLASTINALIGEDNADSNVLRMPRNYQDVISWAIGTEYNINDNLVIRAGYEDRGSAVPDNAVDFMVPLTDADLYSLGFGYQIDAYSSIDVSVAYMHSSFSAGAGESKNANDTEEGQVVYNPYAWSPISGEVNAFLFAISYENAF